MHWPVKSLTATLVLFFIATMSSCRGDGDRGSEGPVITFEKIYGGEYTAEYGSFATQTSDDGYIMFGGYTSVSGERDLYLVKAYSNGDEEWATPLGESGVDEFGYAVDQTSDGGYIMVGNYHSSLIRYNVYLVKADSDGNEEWSRTFGGMDSYEYGSSVQQAKDGGYIILGQASPGPDYGDMYLVKTYPDGSEEWSRTFGGKDDESHETGRSVRQTTDGGYILLGWSNDCFSCMHSDMYLVKTDPDGEEIWSRTFGGDDSDEIPSSVEQTKDGGYIIFGSSYSSVPGQVDFYLVKTDAAGNVTK